MHTQIFTQGILIETSGSDSFLGFVRSKESHIKKLHHHGKIVTHG
jgi:putative hemolysin